MTEELLAASAPGAGGHSDAPGAPGFGARRDLAADCGASRASWCPAR